MSSLFDFLSTGLMCMTVLGLAFMVVLAMPQSRMRDVMKKLLFGVACAIYVISPIDLMPEAILGPFGLVDDLGAVVAGVISVRSALQSAA